MLLGFIFHWACGASWALVGEVWIMMGAEVKSLRGPSRRGCYLWELGEQDPLQPVHDLWDQVAWSRQ